jgi:hypothetical protein
MQDHFDLPFYTGKILDSGRREEMPDVKDRWELVDNGVDLHYCKSFDGNASLVFGGEVVFRRIVTAPLDLRYGARVDYRLRYGNDETCLECCRALFSPGVVSMFLSNNNGPWQPIKTYGIHSYKFGKFEFVREELKAERLSANTRFMWIQPRFSMHRDWWALDNVTILADALPLGWQDLPQWQLTVEQAQTEMQDAQCCFGTDLCNKRRNFQRYDKERCNMTNPEYELEVPTRFDDGAYAIFGCFIV